MSDESNSSSRQPSVERSGTSTPTLSVTNASMDKTPDESSKLRTFLSILKRFIGVSDMASQRFSLPAQLMEPVPNLGTHLNKSLRQRQLQVARDVCKVGSLGTPYKAAETETDSIGDSDEALGRMLGALRFWFTKDLKYVKGKPCKPYNSVLGEFFRCNWDIQETSPPLIGSMPEDNDSKDSIRVTFFTEQTSHHPPVSAYYIDCPEKGVSGRGFDQLMANFTGTRIRVAPGTYNQGIYITLHNHDDESYNLTHPVAHLGGILKGSLTVSVADSCFVTCPKTRLKAILNYAEESWIGKAQNRVTGIIFKYDPEKDDKTKIRDVPESDIVARLDGCWHEQIYFTKGSKPFDKSDKELVVDLAPLWPVPKLIPPEDDQLPNESRRYWSSVTEAIHAKQWTQATTAKQEIEERQRQKAADRKSRNVEWQPRFFTEALKPPGRPELTDEGRDAITRMHNDDYKLTPSAETAA